MHVKVLVLVELDVCVVDVTVSVVVVLVVAVVVVEVVLVLVVVVVVSVTVVVDVPVVVVVVVVTVVVVATHVSHVTGHATDSFCLTSTVVVGSPVLVAVVVHTLHVAAQCCRTSESAEQSGATARQYAGVFWSKQSAWTVVRAVVAVCGTSIESVLHGSFAVLFRPAAHQTRWVGGINSQTHAQPFPCLRPKVLG